MQDVENLVESAQQAVATADAAVIFAMKQQFKYFITLAVVGVVFMLTLLGVVAIQAWQESQVYTEIQYEAIGTMGDSNNVNTGDGNILENSNSNTVN